MKIVVTRPTHIGERLLTPPLGDWPQITYARAGQHPPPTAPWHVAHDWYGTPPGDVARLISVSPDGGEATYHMLRPGFRRTGLCDWRRPMNCTGNRPPPLKLCGILILPRTRRHHVKKERVDGQAKNARSQDRLPPSPGGEGER